MRKALYAVIATMVVGTGGLALAQTKKDAPKPAAAAAAKGPVSPAAPKPKNYEFDADDIQGELVRPTGDFQTVRGLAEHGSLIRVRTDFVREIVKTAEDL